MLDIKKREEKKKKEKKYWSQWSYSTHWMHLLRTITTKCDNLPGPENPTYKNNTHKALVHKSQIQAITKSNLNRVYAP